MIGFICDKKVLGPNILYIIATILAIVGCLTFVLLKQFWSLMCFGIVYGISSAGLNALIVPCIKLITSSNEFSRAYGIVFLFAGLGSLLGPYIAGKLYEFLKI